MKHVALALAGILAAHYIASRTYAKEAAKPVYRALPVGFPHYVLHSDAFSAARLN